MLPQHLDSLKFPVVIKPTLNSHSGEGVICSIKKHDQLLDNLSKSFKSYPLIQIEEFYQGLKEYRVLILKNRILGVVERIAAQVVGDGTHTISELIVAHNHSLAPIQCAILVNTECLLCLADQGFILEDIPPRAKIIRLHYPVNRALGGTSVSLGKKINPENANYLCQAANSTGLDLVGIDLLCEDINLSFSETKWIIIEANFAPGISIHEYPDEGKPMNVSKKILSQLIFQHPLAYIFHRIKLMIKHG